MKNILKDHKFKIGEKVFYYDTDCHYLATGIVVGIFANDSYESRSEDKFTYIVNTNDDHDGVENHWLRQKGVQLDLSPGVYLFHESCIFHSPADFRDTIRY